MKPFSTRIDWTVAIAVGVVLMLSANVALAAQLAKAVRGEIDPFGSVNITFLTTPDCPECFDLNPLREYLTQNGVDGSQIHEVAYDSKAGAVLIKKHEIARVPTAIIPGSLTDLEFMAGLVENLGSVKNGAFVITEVQPPYRDLSSNQVVGRFDVIVVGDASCTECYSPDLHDQVFERLAMKPQNKSVIDVSSEEGKAMIEAYEITAVPTILLRGDLESYGTLQEIWSSVGTIEDDGTYVLRAGVQNMGTYKELPSGKIIKPEQPNP